VDEYGPKWSFCVLLWPCFIMYFIITVTVTTANITNFDCVSCIGTRRCKCFIYQGVIKKY